jgi:quercetin dioxygenase-like cupin family protein
MKIKPASEVPARTVEVDGAKDVRIRLLIHKEENAPVFHMRQFTVEPGGYTPRHTHPWEHEVYILRGRGTAVTPEGDRPIQTGDAIYVAPGDEHQFQNTGAEPLEFLCLVPKENG